MKINKSISFRAVLATFVAMGVLASCNSNEFKVDGKVEGANEQSIVLERGFNGQWIALDSVRTSASGNFALSFEAPTSPEVYRLRLQDQFIYFPIDSLEHISVTADANHFGEQFTLSGSHDAEILMNFEKEANALNLSDSAAVSEFKRKVFNEIIKDSRASVLCYHVLNKTIDGEFLFDPKNSFDLKIYGAVATAYKQFRPNDPRTPLLEMVAMQGRRAANAESGRQRVIEAKEVSLIEIALKDASGKEHKLSETTKQGKPTVVIFSVLTDEKSPEINREIAKIYNANAGRINIFQVCLDYDQLAWKNAAANLPWTVVYDPDGEMSEYAIKYNVQQLPAAYIYDSKGELTEQASSFADLSSKLSKY